MYKASKHTTLILTLLLLSACSARVMQDGTEVTDENTIKAAQVIRNADITAASIATFIKQGYEMGSVSKKDALFYANDVGPAVQDALDTAKEGLVAYIMSKDKDNLVAMDNAINVLVSALNRAIAIAQKYDVDVKKMETN